MLRIDDIRYSVEGRPLFEGASAIIPDGHKVGFVGRNGTGKTTLFKMMTGRAFSLKGGSIDIARKACASVRWRRKRRERKQTLLDTVVLAADRERDRASGRGGDRRRIRIPHRRDP